MASLVAVLLILLSGGIYVLLETPYPKTIAAAIKTHTIAKLLTIPTAVPTAQPTVKPTAHPKPKPTQQAKTTTSTSSSTTTTPVQVVVNNSPSHGNNPTGGGSASPTPQPAHASVAITPATTTANQQFTVDAVVGSPSASEAQARVITATGQQGFTVTATGQGTVAASATTGTLTLFNNTTAPVTVAAGTTISTNDNTVAFTTQQAATVPVPATGQQWGTTNVSVVAQVAGTTGNIAQYAIDAQCCLSAGTVYAINEVAFSGGQNAQTYTYLQQSDIDNAAAPLITSLESSVPASMTSQIRSNEQLIGNVNCVPTVATVSSANSQVASTNGTVSVTCTQEVYDVQGAQRVAAALLQQQESNAGYALTSQVSTGIVGASIIDNQGTVAVVVNTGATARYVFTTARLQQIASMIAGKSLSQVKSILTGMTGVANSVVLLTGGNGTTLPTNVSQITVTAS